MPSRALSVLPALALCALISFFPAPGQASPGEASEARVKAAFLLKFTGYVTWPAGVLEAAGAPMVISVMEADEIADELSQQTAGKLVNSHPVQVRRLSAADPVSGCHVLFIGSAAGRRMAKTLAATQGLPVLTVSELDEGLSQGSVISFVVVDDQVRFDVALPAAERNELRISSRLLTVARRVVAGAP